MKTATEYAEIILREIHADMLQPFEWGKQIPPDVASFSRLHDFCDANCYILDTVHADWDREHGVHDAAPSTSTLSSLQDYTCIICGQLIYELRTDDGASYDPPAWLHAEEQPSAFADDQLTALVNRVSDIVDQALLGEAIALWKERGLAGVIATALASHDTRPCKGYMVLTPFGADQGLDGATAIEVFSWDAPHDGHYQTVSVSGPRERE